MASSLEEIKVEMEALRAQLAEVQQQVPATQEIAFRNAKITVSSTKADFAAEKFDMDTVACVMDLLNEDPRPANLYEQIKRKVINRYGGSPEQRLRQLLRGQVSLDGKPSTVLDRMKSLQSGPSKAVLRSVFLEQLTEPCRFVLSIHNIDSLSKLAAAADRYMDSAGSFNQISTLGAEVSSPSVNAVSSSLSKIQEMLTQMSSRLDRLEKNSHCKSRGRLKNRTAGQDAKSSGDSSVPSNVVPKADSDTGPSAFKLHAANNTFINTYGEIKLTLSLRLNCPVSWNFIVADVPYPIIGADLMHSDGLIVDVRRRRIIDPFSNTFVFGGITSCSYFKVSLFDPSSSWSKILSDFPEITGSKPAEPILAKDIFYYIETTVPPVHERPRRLDPVKFKAAQVVFKTLVKQGVCRVLKSPWASPIHMVKKRMGLGAFVAIIAVKTPKRSPSDFPFLTFAPTDMIKAAVTTPFRLYEYVFMPFGLRNASQSFQRYIFQALGDLDFAFVYLDDVLILSSSIKEHEEHLRTIFGSQPCSEKVEAILDFPLPVRVADLRRFLGLVNFYRRWLPQAASAQDPLFDYTADSKKNDQRVIDWSPEAKQAFETTKSHLAKATLLLLPLSNSLRETGSPWHFFPENEANEATVRTIVVSDHKPLIYAFIQKSDKASPHQQRQLCFLSQLTTAIEYLPGLSNVVADALSRVEVICLPLELELPELAKVQQQDSELSELLKSPAHSLNLKPIELGHSHTSLYCDLTGKIIRPFIPKSLRKRIFD
ncbi:uncharacterized protein LOC106640198 [Copidosoma floridanum]|uniref:uncharacterized protein LOC106640198 n=1 Tax=Copidosoma floridanum TaxID=29053 RepID=UPI0006C9B719|nr:uncharacterized protein LOC106640198 [Copidosoma floridanum]